ncbi:MAG TPA: AIR carboxylase family protein [Nitrospirae bacterium]|nr:AIR carboxylase family protein [Nitrospirota bacterium]
MGRVIIIMGSKADLPWAEKIRTYLEQFEIPVKMRIASAHKVPLRCFEIIKEYDEEDVVFITLAGRSNALSGFVDAQTHRPVIACPPYSDSFAGADIFSSLRMPSGVAPMVVLEPEAAALAAAKILALSDSRVQEKVMAYQTAHRERIIRDDQELSDG